MRRRVCDDGALPEITATQVKCPECGAHLDVEASAAVAICSYCGTTSRVQRRTQIFQLPVRLPPPAHHEPQRVAQQVRTTGGKLVLASILFAGLGVPVLVVAALVAAKAGAFDRTSWEGDGMAIADVDHDGVDDFIAFDRNVRKDQMKLFAVSGRDGKTIWETASLGTYNDVYRDKIVAVGDAVLAADKLAHITGYDLKTGTQRWTAQTSEVAESYCANPPAGHGLLLTKDKAVWAVDLTAGKLERSTTTCDPIDAGLRNIRGCRRADRMNDKIVRAKIDGMYADTIYTCGAGAMIATGWKQPGSSVPMIAALAPADLSGSSSWVEVPAVWAVEIPGHDALKAKTGTVDHVAVSEHDVAVAYERENNAASEVTVFERATGKRRFEVALGKAQMNVLDDIAITGDALAVSRWGTLDVFDLKTGAKRFTLGN